MAIGGLRSRRATADAGVRDERPRPRHEHLDVAGLPLPGARPRCAARCSRRRSSATGRAGAATATWTATASRIARCPATACPAYFTRGTGHNEQAAYSERPGDWVRQPRPPRAQVRHGARAGAAARGRPRPTGRAVGVIAYGTSHWATVESRDQLAREHGIRTSYYRLRAFPFTHHLGEFLAAARPRLRGRAESRRTDARPDAGGARPGAAAKAAVRPPLQRAAARRPVVTDEMLRQEGRGPRRAPAARGTHGPRGVHARRRVEGEHHDGDTHSRRLPGARSIGSAWRCRPTGAARPRCARGAGTTRFPSASSMPSSTWASTRSR